MYFSNKRCTFTMYFYYLNVLKLVFLYVRNIHYRRVFNVHWKVIVSTQSMILLYKLSNNPLIFSNRCKSGLY